MMMTPLPTRQSWAMWAMPMMRQSSPISVHPSGVVARWMIAYSRMTVRAPTRTPEIVPGLNLRSCGSPPSALPWPMETPGPITTGPSRIACAPTTAPSPRLTSGPMIENGPTVTPAPMRALGSMSALRWMVDSAVAIAPSARAQPRFQLGHPALHHAQPPRKVGEVRLRDPDAFLLRHRARRRAHQLLARLDVAMDTRLGGHHGAIADRHVVGDTDLPR